MPRRRRLYRLSMKKRPDELVITALLYDVLNFWIGGLDVCLFVCWQQNLLFTLETVYVIHTTSCVLHCCIGCTRRPWQRHQENANAATEAAALQAMQEESTRLAGEHKGGSVTSNFYLERTVHFPVFVRLQVYLKRCAVLSLDSAVSFYTISTASCTVRTFRSR